MARVNPPLPLTTVPVLRFRVFGTLLGQTTETTFLYMPTTTPAEPPSLDDWSDAFNAAVLDKYNSAISASWQGNIIRADRFDDPTKAFLDTDISAVAGDLAGNPAPSFVSSRIARTTAVAGQHGRGTLRIPGIVEEFTTGNQVDGAQLTALGLLADALLLPLATANPAEGTYRHCIATRTISGPPELTTIVRASMVVTAIVSLQLGTSRSRMPRSTI